MSPPTNLEASHLHPLAHLALGPVLQCAEAATLGLPFEVLKTRQGRFRSESVLKSFAAVYEKGGVTGFWAGLSPKMVESASKGAVLLASKEALFDAFTASGFGPVASGVVAGAGGGVCQVAVMGPTTLAITHKVVSSSSAPSSTAAILSQAWRKDGLRGWYPGGTALALRQASNWALRQGFTEAARVRMLAARHAGEGTSAKLSRSEELVCGIIGGTLSTLNQPFEVARIEAQSRSAAGEPALSMPSVVRIIVKQSGFAGLYAGILPRIGLAVWQTTFMVVAPKLIRAFAEEMDEELSSTPDAVALEEEVESE